MIFNSSCTSMSPNFSIVGGTVTHANPKDNTILVVTNVTITGYSFSDVEPTDPYEGLVWVRTGGSNVDSFLAFENHSVTVYPVYAKQYINSEWKNVIVRRYHDGIQTAWPSGLLYGSHFPSKNTDDYGYWHSLMKQYDETHTAVYLYCGVDNIYGIDCLVIGANFTAVELFSGVCTLSRSVDLSPYNKLVVTLCPDFFGSTDRPSDAIYINIWDEIGTYITDNLVVTKCINAAEYESRQFVTVELDVSSLTEEYHIGFGIVGYSVVAISDMYLV